MRRLEPRKPSRRILTTSPKRGSHQEFWPEVEVVSHVTVQHHFTWGTDSATYEIVSREVVDIRSGYTREAIDQAHRRGEQRNQRIALLITEGHPVR